jgi:hypothetical protein
MAGGTAIDAKRRIYAIDEIHRRVLQISPRTPSAHWHPFSVSGTLHRHIVCWTQSILLPDVERLGSDCTKNIGCNLVLGQAEMTIVMRVSEEENPGLAEADQD